MVQNLHFVHYSHTKVYHQSGTRKGNGLEGPRSGLPALIRPLSSSPSSEPPCVACGGALEKHPQGVDHMLRTVALRQAPALRPTLTDGLGPAPACGLPLERQILSEEALRRGATLTDVMAISKDLLEILVCPLCKATVEMKPDESGLKCVQCKRVYPIRDDIPVMLVDEARIEE